MRAWGCPGVGERELADDTGLARSAYMSSESALLTELLLEAEDTLDTLLTLRDLHRDHTEHRERDSVLCHKNTWFTRSLTHTFTVKIYILE